MATLNFLASANANSSQLLSTFAAAASNNSMIIFRVVVERFCKNRQVCIENRP